MSGYKDFVAGDPLTAAQVDGYLMRQSVMVFASAAARDAALSGVLVEGMTCYLTDAPNHLLHYDGAAWSNSIADEVDALTTYLPATPTEITDPVVDGTNWTTSYVGMIRWGPILMVSYIATRKNSNLIVPSSGNVGNETVFTMPVSARGTQNGFWQGISTHTNGQITATGVKSDTGVVQLTATVPSSNIDIGDQISGGGVIMLDK